MGDLVLGRHVGGEDLSVLGPCGFVERERCRAVTRHDYDGQVAVRQTVRFFVVADPIAGVTRCAAELVGQPRVEHDTVLVGRLIEPVVLSWRIGERAGLGESTTGGCAAKSAVAAGTCERKARLNIANCGTTWGRRMSTLRRDAGRTCGLVRASGDAARTTVAASRHGTHRHRRCSPATMICPSTA